MDRISLIALVPSFILWLTCRSVVGNRFPSERSYNALTAGKERGGRSKVEGQIWGTRDKIAGHGACTGEILNGNRL